MYYREAFLCIDKEHRNLYAIAPPCGLVPLCMGQFKINVDGAFGNQIAWVGVVVKNDQGEVMIAIAKPFNYHTVR